MNASELLSRLDAMGVELAVGEEGRLRANVARGQLDDTLKQAIATHKSELIELLRGRASAHAPVNPVPRGGVLPMSFFQERLWLLQRLEPANTDYLIEAHWLAPAGFAAAQVTAALERVRARHEGLRVAFFDEGGAPVARATEPSAIETIALIGLHPEAQKHRLDSDVDRAVHTPIEFAPAAPVRFAVYALQPGLALVMVTAHHISLDAWSIDLLRGELAVELTTGSSAPPTLQYADFAGWQRSTQDPARIAGELDWWAAKLRGAPALSAFPADHPAGEARAGRSLDFEWDSDLSDALRGLAREEGATPYMALLAACAALLRAHTGQTDVVFGSPMGLRERSDFERVVGPFVNLLLIRLDLSDDPSFAQLLRRARDAVLDAHAHRQVPFEMLIERVKPARSFEHSPLFQTALVQHNATVQGDLVINSGGALHDLTWFLRERDGHFVGSVEYRSDLYSSAAVKRIATQTQQLLRGAIADRGRAVSLLPLLAPHELDQLVHGFNATARESGLGSFVADFERQARATPQRTAIVFEGAALDYAGLDARANQLARRLRALGAAPGALVGICLERSLELLVALIATQKSGAAYVPLDPGFPAERLAYMLVDSGAGVLVTAGEAADALELPAGLHVVDLVAEAVALAALEAGPIEPLAGPGDTAYVIYTSGSTGRPKGVAIPHGALANFLGSMRREPGLAADDVLAAITTISFDIAGLELYLPLIVGARIELIAREIASDGELLARQLDACAATVLQATPATWRLLIEAGWRPARQLRALCGGEGLPRELANSLLSRVHELWNLYGPTETTIWSTLERVHAGQSPVRIGRPIDNTQVYVLDAAGEPVSVGVAGELWIGGRGVALGYHRRPELTAERFVLDRFAAQPGVRVYRTGDLARWDEEGCLHHLGRLDYQVKIRGFRIELGEIEAVLAKHPAIRQALVTARETAPGDQRLVAYVVYERGEDLTVSDVRRHLRRELPDYMVPSVVVALDAMPLTTNGKVDRLALPDPFRIAVLSSSGFVPPAPGPEMAMAEIWSNLLQVERVGADDNFFELGGHSLLSLRAASAFQKQFGWRVDARTMFFQNLRQVVAVARRSSGEGAL